MDDTTTTEVPTPAETAPAFEDVTVEELVEHAGSSTTSTGGTLSSTTCPACIGTAFSWS